MGPRLGRVEYGYGSVEPVRRVQASMGPRLGRVEYIRLRGRKFLTPSASMGPRLGRVEYQRVEIVIPIDPQRFNGATLRTRGIPT